MNYGIFKGDQYIKKISFSKAVLWHTRQLSLRSDIMHRIQEEEIKYIIFADELKKEQWIFDPIKVFETMTLKRVGQEEQYYFSIDLAKKKKLVGDIEKRPIRYKFDPEKQVYYRVEEEV